MATIDVAMSVIHLVFAGLWTGATVFVSLGVLPAAGAGDLGAAARERLASRFVTTARASALLTFVSGGHAAGTRYTVSSLTDTTAGLLVLAMLALWAVLAGLSEVGGSRLEAGRTEAATRLFAAGSVTAVLLLVVGGVLAVR